MGKKIVFFGDSICAGYRAPQGMGWVERLAALLPDMEVVNAGVSGETSKDALRRFDVAVAAHRPTLVYVQFGLNDASWWCRQPGKPWLSEEVYIETMRAIIDRCVACKAKTLVATNHPVLDHALSCTDDVPAVTHSYAAQVRQYNAALRNALGIPPLAGTVTLVDIEKAILDSGPPPAELLDPDGVHLNQHGNIFYTRTVADALRAIL